MACNRSWISFVEKVGLALSGIGEILFGVGALYITTRLLKSLGAPHFLIVIAVCGWIALLAGRRIVDFIRSSGGT